MPEGDFTLGVSSDATLLKIIHSFAVYGSRA